MRLVRCYLAPEQLTILTAQAYTVTHTMALLLNAVNLPLCLRWFHRSGSGPGRLLGIVPLS